MRASLSYDESLFASMQPGAQSSAYALVPLVIELLSPHSVVDVGCGTAHWLATFSEHGVDEILGYDRECARDFLLIPEEYFQPADLAEPLRADRSFDLAVSLEVAEHLPAQAADDFVASLTSLAPAVLFSAAVPFQARRRHLNEQWPDYWARRFAAAGYQPVDCFRPRIWADPRVAWWYAQNCILYATEQYIAANRRLGPHVVGDPSQLARLHPGNYIRKCDPRFASGRNTIRLLIGIVRTRISERWFR